MEVNLELDLGHGSGWSTRLDPSQRMDKNSYYYSLKPNSGVDPGQGSGRESQPGLTQILKKKSKQSCFDKKKIQKKINEFFTHVLS